MIKKLFTLLFAVGILAGCETIDVVVEDAAELKTSVVAKVAEVQVGIENVITGTQEKYELLLEKKAELETMVAEINEVVESVNKLLGRDDTDAAETENLRTTITELQSALDAANSTLGEIETEEENLESAKSDEAAGTADESGIE